MRHIDFIRILSLVPMAFLFDWIANGSNPAICISAAIITAFPLVLAEAKHKLNRRARK